jgi:hypothetical protein
MDLKIRILLLSRETLTLAVIVMATTTTATTTAATAATTTTATATLITITTAAARTTAAAVVVAVVEIAANSPTIRTTQISTTPTPMITEIEILIVAEQVAEKERGVEAERERRLGVGIEVETGVEAGKGVEVEVREIVFQRVTGTMEDQDLEVASMISGIGRKEGTETERREGIGTGTETGSVEGR